MPLLLLIVEIGRIECNENMDAAWFRARSAVLVVLVCCCSALLEDSIASPDILRRRNLLRHDRGLKMATSVGIINHISVNGDRMVSSCD